MRRTIVTTGGAIALLTLAGCGSGPAGVFGRSGPDEMAVTRQQPLVIPPDYSLTPPRPGAPRPQEADSSSQALQAMFGGPARVSPGEAAVVGSAGGTRNEPGVRSTAGDPGTTSVDKGSVTRDIIAAPEGTGPDATVTTTKQ